MQFVDDHSDVVAIEYHAWWPSSADPLYQHNTAENSGRIQYYGVNATPTVWVDGVVEPNWVYSYANHNAAYNTRKGVPTSVTLSHTGSYDSGTAMVDLTVTASTDASLPAGDYRLHAVLTESDVFWAAPNGIDIHDHVMRDMFPNQNGTPVSFGGGLPQMADATASFDVSGYDAGNCHVVYFLQNHSTKEVFQAGTVSLDELVDDTAVAEAPAAFRLGRNYPNPFNPTTVIPVSMDRGEPASLAIIDARGRRVRTLHSGLLVAGEHEFSWDGRDDGGAAVASGVYMAQLRTSVDLESMRVVLLK